MISLQNLKSGRYWETGVYLGSTVISRMIPFALMPLITFQLGPDGFGSWAIFSALMTFFAPFVGLMMRTQIARLFYSSEQSELASLVSTVLVLTLATSLLLLGIALLLLTQSTFTVAGIPIELLAMIPILALLLNIQELAMMIFRYQRAPVRYAAFELGETLLCYSSLLMLILYTNYNWVSFIAAKFISTGLIAVCGIYFLWRSQLLPGILKWSHLATGLAISIPLIPHALSSTIIGTSDRLLLDYMTNTETVGVYSVGYILGSAVLLVSTAFSKTWLPWVHEKLSSDQSSETRETIVRFSYKYFSLVTICGLLFWLGGHLFIVWFLDPRYRVATEVLPWIVLATIFQSYYFSVHPILTYIGKTKVLASSTFLAATINIIMTIILVRANGMVGAAQATLLAYIVQFIAMIYTSQMHFPLPWRSVAVSHFSKR